MKSIFLILFILFNCFINGQTVRLSSFASGFSDAVEIVNAGDNRLFIVEKAGVIKILNPDGSVNTTPFLNIRNIVGSGGERGLLRLAFAPDYNTSGRFYVHYTDNSSTNTPNSIIARYTVSANPNIANTTGSILLSYAQPFSNHNGGKIAFGADDYLYIASGDGGSGGDPGDRAQDNTTLLGKLLRIDVKGATYTIPPSNPFSNSANGINDPRPEIYAIGLRNPWKFSFDTQTDDLWIADVGQNNFEEINRVVDSGSPGDNYGWRCFEGSSIFSNSGSCPLPGGIASTIAPIAEYAHSGNGCTGSVTGGYVYRGTEYSSFIGKYIFADFCKETIGILTNTVANNWSLAFQTPNITERWTTLGEDNSGELYISGGTNIYKITEDNLSTNDNISDLFKIYPNPVNGTLFIDLTLAEATSTNIKLLNILGQEVTTVTNNTDQIIRISTKNYKNGLYFVNIILDDGSSHIQKVILN